MKQDNQHLDFLISQYVDGCLEGAGKKSVEQQMLNDPEARKLYAEHRETQDLLDDWGNRIPLIDWEDFDKKLEARLETETVGAQRKTGWRYWAKPMSIAAGLLVAATVGFAARGVWSPAVPVKDANPIVGKAELPFASVTINDGERTTQPAFMGIGFNEDGALAGPGPWAEGTPVAVMPPEDSAARDLIESVNRGLTPLAESVKPGGAVGAGTAVLPAREDLPQPQFP